MSRLPLFGFLSGCSYQDVCPIVDEHHLGPDAAGPDGFSANELLAFVGAEHVYDTAPWPEADRPIGVDGSLTVTIGDRRGRPLVREWTCTPPTLYVTADVRVASADGTLDVEGELEIYASALTDAAVGWSVLSESPLDGIVPQALVDAAAVEQQDHCPEDADEQATVRVFLSRYNDAAALDFDAQYAHHRVCNYAASLATASLVPR